MGFLNIKALTSTRKPSYTYSNYLGGVFSTPELNNDYYIRSGFKLLPNVYGIVTWQTAKSSSVPFEIYEVKDKKKDYQYKCALQQRNYKKALKLKSEALERVEGSELEALLLNPNKLQNTQQFFESVDSYTLLTGNGVIWGSDMPMAGINKGKPKELYSLPSPYMKIEVGKEFGSIKGYKIDIFNEMLNPEEIGHIKLFNPLVSGELYQNSYYGYSPLASCRTLLKKMHLADQSQGSAFQNQGIGGVLTADDIGDLTPTQAQEMQKDFEQFNTGAKNAGKIKITSAKLRWLPMAQSPADLQIMDAKDEMLGELCNAYHVSKVLFQTQDAKYNNKNEARKESLTDAVIPQIERRKAVLNDWLAPKFTPSNGKQLRIEFDYTYFEELQDDNAEKWKWVSELPLTENQKLQEMGYEQNPDPNMDKVYMRAGMIPLDELNMPVDDIDEEIIGGEAN